MGVTGELQVHILDVTCKVRLMNQQDDWFRLRDAFQSLFEVVFPFQNVTQSREPESRAIALERN